MYEIKSKSLIRDAYKDLVTRLSLDERRTIYHLTVVYQDRTCFEKTRNQNKDYCISSIFSRFYMSRLLPYIMNTQNYTRVSFCDLQPIMIVFPEKHKERFTYHHHAIICATKETIERLDVICDKELIDLFPFRNIQSMRLTKRDIRVIDYASKEYSKLNDDVLIFSSKERVKDTNIGETKWYKDTTITW